MKLTELSNILIVEAGQYIIADDPTDFALNLDRLWLIVRDALAFYGDYKIKSSKFNISMTGDRVLTFTGTEDEIPEWISHIVPVGGLTTSVMSSTALFSLHRRYHDLTRMGQLEEPREFIWEYRKPKLYVSELGDYEITAHYDRSFDLIQDSSGELVDIDIPDITYKDYLFKDLVLGKFLMAIGKSRRGFILGELPVQFDADAMVSEGRDKVKETQEMIIARGDWGKALG